MTEEKSEVENEDAGTESPPASADAPADPLTEARAEIAKLKDAYMRTAADFDNYRKRSRREVDDARKAGREELLKELLPVFDNLGRAIQSTQKATDLKAVAEGVSMVGKQFDGTLGRLQITRVPTIGLMFDPSLHEAIQQVETNDHPPGTVVAEVQPGYSSGDRLIRAAMVVVAKPKADEEAPKAES